MTGKRAVRITLASFVAVAALGLAAWYATPATLRWYAERAFAAKNYARADKVLQMLIAIEPNDKRTRFLHARVLRQLEKYAEADAELGMAGELGLPKEEGIREFGLLWAPKSFAHAEGALQQAAKKNPGDVEVLEALTQGYMRQLRPRDTEKYLTRWIEARPDDVQPRLERGRLYLDLREFNKSVADLSEAVKMSPGNYRAHLWLGLALL
ncbi:MAG TPA: tetratricopeptide repeat protein, partial [Gemmataceae bacterium]|nr:tetratricopeptide repeat protein [Gemmataceae bacterium]